MADERLTDKSELTTVADGDKVHIVDVSDTSQNAAGSSKWITKANLVGTPFAGAFTDLSDVDETTLTGQEGRVPQVRAGSLKLNRLPTYEDLLGGNAIIEGGVTYITGALSYYAFGESYIINNELIDTYVSAFVTLSNGDATNPRIDVITITMTAGTPSIVVVAGTPAASPVKPAIDLATQVELSFITVAALATTDTTATTEVIYDENLGETAEWDITDTPAGANLSDNTDPAVGTVAITLPAYTSDTIEWTKASLYTYVADEHLCFYMRIASGITDSSKMTFKLIDSNTAFYYNFSAAISVLRNYGFIDTVTTWQLVNIPLSLFVKNSFIQTQYDQLEITFTATPALELDWIVVQGSVVNPSNQGIGKFKNGDNALDAVYTEGNVGIKTTQPTQALDVAGNININEASAYLQDGVQAVKLAQNGQGFYLNTFVGDNAGNENVLSINQTGVGFNSGAQNVGENQAAFGHLSGRFNMGAFQSASGSRAGYANLGADQTAIGKQAGNGNNGASNTFLGSDAGAAPAVDVSGVKTFDGTDVNITTQDITIATHGFGSNGTWVNLFFTQGTAALGDFFDGEYKQFYIRDANTISGLEGTRRTLSATDQNGTGHSFTPLFTYTNSMALGASSAITKSNQIVLGDTSVAEVVTSGVVITGGYTVAALPTGVTGARTYVTDANATTFNSTVAAGGANVVPVFYNGTNWVIG